jgi:hypothetical protein
VSKRRENQLAAERLDVGDYGEQKVWGRPDPKPRPRERLSKQDYRLLQSQVVRGKACRICLVNRAESAHHIVPRNPAEGGDDVYENLVELCGDGVRGCHGDVEARRNDARQKLRQALSPAELEYVLVTKGQGWLDRHYPTEGGL